MSAAHTGLNMLGILLHAAYDAMPISAATFSESAHPILDATISAIFSVEMNAAVMEVEKANADARREMLPFARQTQISNWAMMVRLFLKLASCFFHSEPLVSPKHIILSFWMSWRRYTGRYVWYRQTG